MMCWEILISIYTSVYHSDIDKTTLDGSTFFSKNNDAFFFGGIFFWRRHTEKLLPSPCFFCFFFKAWYSKLQVFQLLRPYLITS